VGNSRAPACEGSPSFEVRRNCENQGDEQWSQRLAGIGLAGLVGKTVQSSSRGTGEGFRQIDDCSFRAPLFCQAGLACGRALVAIRLRSSMHVSRRRRWMALAVRGVYDDLVYGSTRPFVAFQGSSWVGYPGFAIPGSDRGQSAPRASKGEWEALVHPLARRALSRS